MDFRFRPLPVWPHPETPADARRGRWAFRAPWSSTLALLDDELRLLRASGLVIGAGFTEADLRLDGLPRANARPPRHPGIELSFDTPDKGRLVYATDVCERWEHNVRSIALGLEALRAVDRYGITARGQQYAGFKQLTAGGGDVARGMDLIARYGGIKQALMATHPDHDGDPDDFAAVQAARDAMDSGAFV